MEKQVIEGLKKVFNIENNNEISKISRLLGGMSNSTYEIEINNEKYSYRIPGKNAEKFVDRIEEQSNINRISDLDLNNHTIYLDVNTGIKIAKFVEGQPLSELEITEKNNLEKSAKLLKKLHNSNRKAEKDYNPIERLEKYERLVGELGFIHEEKYKTLKAKFLENIEFLNNTKMVFCHNDSQPSNIVIGNTKDYLLDWEFAGNNDLFYDIACFGNLDFEHALAILPIYLKREPNKEELERVHLWRVFQCLQWHNVALYKEATGLSKELNVPFDIIAKNYLVKVEGLFEKLGEIK